MLTNCNVTVKDVRLAVEIYGPNIKAIVGKTTSAHKKGKLIDVLSTSVPQYILDEHSNVTILADTIHVNQIPFMVTVSKPIENVTVQALETEQVADMKKALDKIVNGCKVRGFNVARIDADGGFKPLEEYYGGLMNICAHEEHVPAIERKIRVLKESYRADLCGVPFGKIPKLLTIYLVYRETMWLNSFPSPSTGVSRDMGPREIMTGKKCDYKKKL